MTFIEALIESINSASRYNRNDQSSPVALLWTDKERLWEPLIPLLRSSLPLLTFGTYRPEERTGPAYWLRCVIARSLPGCLLSENAIPIIYLPGISRQEIRAIEDCPKELQPLADLQYRGILWTQRNGRDWTPLAFLVSEDGLGVKIASDVTKDVLNRSIHKLATESIAGLRKESLLRAAYFDNLLHPDDVRTLLSWLNSPLTYAKNIKPEEWQSFCHLCQQKYGFHPEKDGAINAAEKLGQHKGNWDVVWKRYLDAPEYYANIPDLLRKARPPQLSLFETSDSWPQDNEAAERELRDQLSALAGISEKDARAIIFALEQKHASRREWIWARLNQSPLAMALLHLAELASLTVNRLAGASTTEIRKAYTDWGWKVDAATLDALASVHAQEDVAIIKIAVRVLYQPWLEKSVTDFQSAYERDTQLQDISLDDLYQSKSTVILFSDALRFDAGMRLSDSLISLGLQANVRSCFAALPTITSTAKNAISPVGSKLSGKGASDLTPNVMGGSIITADKLRKLLDEAGFQPLSSDELGDPKGRAWTELGALDAFGHQHGWKISYHLMGELDGLRNRNFALLDHGWERVVVITDHGWLLLPGGLPKITLPEHLTELRKGRCARLKPFSETDQQVVSWYWDADVRIAIAPGISCYESGKEYEHGGLSPQECVVPVITITRGYVNQKPDVEIESVAWLGLRCRVKMSGDTSQVKVDLRRKAGDTTTSLISEPKIIGSDGMLSMMVEDDDQEGSAVFVVVLTAQDEICAQRLTIVGE
jgi:hypothetical protein